MERFQLVPVNEQAFVYEQNAGGNDGRSGMFKIIEFEIRWNEHWTRISIAGSDSPETETIAIQTTANGQTVYVTSQHSAASANDDGIENLRYNPNGSGNNGGPSVNGEHQLRYAEDPYPPRYEYQAHHHAPNNAEEIKIELIRNQHSALHAAKMQHNGDPQHSQPEPKIQYTNLDVSPQNYYSIATEGYQPTGSGFAYLSAGPSKDYGIYQGSPNAVLYKGEINSVEIIATVNAFGEHMDSVWI